MEIARRGIAAGAKLKDFLPVFDEGWREVLRKALALPSLRASCKEQSHYRLTIAIKSRIVE
jgi:hypothetical protein